MAHQITVSDEIFERLKRLAEPFVDREPQDVLRRLLDQNESARSNNNAHGKFEVGPPVSDHEGLLPISRAPRERGTVV